MTPSMLLNALPVTQSAEVGQQQPLQPSHFPITLTPVKGATHPLNCMPDLDIPTVLNATTVPPRLEMWSQLTVSSVTPLPVPGPAT